MTTGKTGKGKNKPGEQANAVLLKMDRWVIAAYLATPLLLAVLGGFRLVGLVILIYPVISVVFFYLRHRYLKSVPSEQQRHIVPYSYIYTGRSISAIILLLLAGSCALAVFNLLLSGH